MDSFDETAPLRGSEDSNEQTELWGSGWLCFSGLCFRGEVGETAERAKKVREISEIFAGPEWKNLIWRFRFHGMINCSNNKKTMTRRMDFRYDPESYKLNFDEGDCRNDFPDVSSRFPHTPQLAATSAGD